MEAIALAGGYTDRCAERITVDGRLRTGTKILRLMPEFNQGGGGGFHVELAIPSRRRKYFLTAKVSPAQLSSTLPGVWLQPIFCRELSCAIFIGTTVFHKIRETGSPDSRALHRAFQKFDFRRFWHLCRGIWIVAFVF